MKSVTSKSLAQMYVDVLPMEELFWWKQGSSKAKALPVSPGGGCELISIMTAVGVALSL